MSKISVIVPVYNVETYLRRCVDSVLRQTYADYDLLLVDDGSPDRCGSICDEYAAADLRIKVIHQNNGGLSAARNAGIEWALAESDSEWISFLDSDDWIHPEYLEQLLAAVRKTDLPIAMTGFLRTSQVDLPPADTAELQVQVWETEEFYCSDKVTATIACGKLYRKKDFSDIRYPVGKIHEDELTTHKLLFRYDRIAYIDQALYYYFQNPESIMRSGWSPKHISEVEGMADQLRFFREHNHPKAAACAANAYLNSIYRNLTYARSGGVQYIQEAEALRKRLREGLRKYGRLARVDRKKAPWLFYEAFPLRMLPVRLWKKLKKNK